MDRVIGSEIDALQRETFGYFEHEVNAANGLVWDKPSDDSPASIAHQLSHLWIDFRGIQDDFMRNKGIDYFENTRRATRVQRRYAMDNPLKFNAYGPLCWGITASDGPGPESLKIDGVERRFFNYIARGAPFGPDDGTLAPWAVVASLPFAPDIVRLER